MTMRTVRSKVWLAGLFAACVCGGLGIGVALATPGAGVTAALLSGPVALDEINIVSQNETHGMILKTRGEWECRTVHFTVAPGGYFGWHSHPGPVFVMITAGTLTKVEADGTVAQYPAGTGFVESAGNTHNAGIAGTVDVKIVEFFLSPKGAPIRIDEPAPE
jgi:quercetin dioxygenase-like cupin family protein